MISTVFLSLGSSMEPRLKFLTDAVSELKNHPDIQALEVSNLYETAPLGGVANNRFLNLALKINVKNHSPSEFLDLIHSIEAKAGRKRDKHWGDRTLDIDILFWDDLILNSDTLTIPHPEISRRDFVLKPLADLSPDTNHPVENKTVKTLLNELSETGNPFILRDLGELVF